MKKILLVLVLLCIGTVGWGQMKPEEVSKRMTSNFQKLREYSWSTQTEVSLKGQQISVTLEKLRYDLDGKLQIIPLGGTATLLTKGNEVEFPAEQLFSFTSAKEFKIGR